MKEYQNERYKNEATHFLGLHHGKEKGENQLDVLILEVSEHQLKRTKPDTARGMGWRSMQCYLKQP